MSVNRVSWAVLACPLHLRLRTYRCEAANPRFGPRTGRFNRQPL